MDFLTQQEISGFKQDIKHGDAKQIAEKTEFEKKLLDGLVADMENTIEHPERQKSVKFAKKINKRKRRAIWKENLKKIFGKP
jgi:translation elongation factor EF-Tu-like GTPase